MKKTLNNSNIFNYLNKNLNYNELKLLKIKINITEKYKRL